LFPLDTRSGILRDVQPAGAPHRGHESAINHRAAYGALHRYPSTKPPRFRRAHDPPVQSHRNGTPPVRTTASTAPRSYSPGSAATHGLLRASDGDAP